MPEFAYAGSFAFDLDAVARVERHVFVDVGVDAGRQVVRRLIVVHFEAFLRGVEDLYRYALADPVLIGGATYGRSANTLSVAAERNEAPKGEMARTDAFHLLSRVRRRHRGHPRPR